jgi:site-specific recombinase XerD
MNITFSQTVKEYFEARRAQRYSEHTLLDYNNTFTKFQHFLGEDPLLENITPRIIVHFMGSTTNVSKKTALNYHTGLSSLWGWAAKNGYCHQNIVRLVEPPKPGIRTVIPLSRGEVSLLVEAASEGRCSKRDIAIILTLLDTGARASELCELKIKDLNTAGRYVRVVGKGDKERQLKVCGRSLEVIIEYLDERGIKVSRKYHNTPLFATNKGNKLERDALRLLMERLADRCGVYPVHAHRFRHTFAINFLRNGGNIYTLQDFLGHTALDMVKIYLQLAQIDIDRDHDRASPVKVWGL